MTAVPSHCGAGFETEVENTDKYKQGIRPLHIKYHIHLNKTGNGLLEIAYCLNCSIFEFYPLFVNELEA